VIFVYPLISLIGNSAPGTIEGYLSMLETALFEDEAGSDFDFGETSLGGDSNAIEHSGGLSSVNKTRNMGYGGHSAASEAGSVIYGGLSPASEVGSRNNGKVSPPPIRKGGSTSYGGLTPASEVGSRNYWKISPSPIRKAGSTSYGRLSAASEAGSRNYWKCSPSPIRKAGSSRIREEPRLGPVSEAGTASYASTDVGVEDANRDQC
jgi:hypothetical protein